MARLLLGRKKEDEDKARQGQATSEQDAAVIEGRDYAAKVDAAKKATKMTVVAEHPVDPFEQTAKKSDERIIADYDAEMAARDGMAPGNPKQDLGYNDVTIDFSSIKDNEQAAYFASTMYDEKTREAVLKDWASYSGQDEDAVLYGAEQLLGTRLFASPVSKSGKAAAQEAEKNAATAQAAMETRGAAMQSLSGLNLMGFDGQAIDINTADPATVVRGINSIADSDVRAQAAKLYKTLTQTEGSRFYGENTDGVGTFLESANLTQSDYKEQVSYFNSLFYGDGQHGDEDAGAYLEALQEIESGDYSAYVKSQLTAALDKAYTGITGSSEKPQKEEPIPEETGKQEEEAPKEKKPGFFDGLLGQVPVAEENAQLEGQNAPQAVPQDNTQVQPQETSQQTKEVLGATMQAQFGGEENGGNVDLTRRPEVSYETMAAAGWGDYTEEGGTSTVLTTGYGAPEDGFMAQMTPIREDGTVLTPEELDAYYDKVAGAVKAGESIAEADPEHLVLASKQGTPEELESQTDWLDQYGEELHNAQAAFYGMAQERPETQGPMQMTAQEQIVANGGMSFAEWMAAGAPGMQETQQLTRADTIGEAAQALLTGHYDEVEGAGKDELDRMLDSSGYARRMIGTLTEGDSRAVELGNDPAEDIVYYNIATQGQTIKTLYDSMMSDSFPEELRGVVMAQMIAWASRAEKMEEQGTLGGDPELPLLERLLTTDEHAMDELDSTYAARDELLADKAQMRRELEEQNAQTLEDARTAALKGTASEEQLALVRENADVSDAAVYNDDGYWTRTLDIGAYFAPETDGQSAFSKSSVKLSLDAQGVIDTSDYENALYDQMSALLDEDTRTALALGMSLEDYYAKTGGVDMNALCERAASRISRQGAAIGEAEMAALDAPFGQGVGNGYMIGAGIRTGGEQWYLDFRDSLYVGWSQGMVERNAAKIQDRYQNAYGAYGRTQYRKDIEAALSSGTLDENYAAALRTALTTAADPYQLGIDPMDFEGDFLKNSAEIRRDIETMEGYMRKNATENEFKWFGRVKSMTYNAVSAGAAALTTAATGNSLLGFNVGYSVVGFKNNFDEYLQKGYSVNSAKYLGAVNTALDCAVNLGTFNAAFGRLTGMSTLTEAAKSAIVRNPAGASKGLAAIRAFGKAFAQNEFDEVVHDEFFEGLAANWTDNALGDIFRKLDAGEDISFTDGLKLTLNLVNPANLDIQDAAQGVVEGAVENAIGAVIFSLHSAKGAGVGTLKGVQAAQDLMSGKRTDVDNVLKEIAKTLGDEQACALLNDYAQKQKEAQAVAQEVVSGKSENGSAEHAAKAKEQAEQASREATAAQTAADNSHAQFEEAAQAVADGDLTRQKEMSQARVREGENQKTANEMGAVAERRTGEMEQAQAQRMEEARQAAAQAIRQQNLTIRNVLSEDRQARIAVLDRQIENITRERIQAESEFADVTERLMQAQELESDPETIGEIRRQGAEPNRVMKESDAKLEELNQQRNSIIDEQRMELEQDRMDLFRRYKEAVETGNDYDGMEEAIFDTLDQIRQELDALDKVEAGVVRYTRRRDIRNLGELADATEGAETEPAQTAKATPEEIRQKIDGAESILRDYEQRIAQAEKQASRGRNEKKKQKAERLRERFEEAKTEVAALKEQLAQAMQEQQEEERRAETRAQEEAETARKIEQFLNDYERQMEDSYQRTEDIERQKAGIEQKRETQTAATEEKTQETDAETPDAPVPQTEESSQYSVGAVGEDAGQAGIDRGGLKNPVFQRFTSVIGRHFGTQIVVANLGDGLRGHYDPQTNRLFISSRMGTGEAMRTVLCHELTHFIENSAGYDAYKAAALQAAYHGNETDMQHDVERITEVYAPAYERDGRTFTQEDAQKELVARATETVVGKLADWTKTGGETQIYDLLGEKQRFGIRLYNSLTQFIAKVKAKAAGKIEEYNELVKARDALKAALRDAGKQTSEDGKQYAIRMDKGGKPVVSVEEDILAGVPQKEWTKTAKQVLKEKFPNGVTVGNNQIQITGKSRNEITNSKDTRWLKNNQTDMYADKMRAANHADEIIQASTDYVSQGLLHERKDDIVDFGHGNVQIEIGGQLYDADVVVGTKKDGSMLLYDFVRMTKKETQRTAGRQSAPHDIRAASLSDDSISQNRTPVNIYDMPKDGQHALELNQFDNQTAQNADALTDRIKKELLGGTHEKQVNRKQVEQANAQYDRRGADAIIADLAAREMWTAEDIVTAQVAMLRSEDEGYLVQASQIAQMYSKRISKAGQALQAGSVIKRLTASGAMAETVKRADSVNRAKGLTDGSIPVGDSAPVKNWQERQKQAQGDVDAAAHGQETEDGTIRKPAPDKVVNTYETAQQEAESRADSGEVSTSNPWGVPLSGAQMALIDRYGLRGTKLPGYGYFKATLKERQLAAILATPNNNRGDGLLTLCQQLEFMKRGYAVVTEADLNYITGEMATYQLIEGENETPQTPEGKTIIQRLYSAQANTSPNGAWEKFNNYGYDSMLSSAKTWSKNVGSNILTRPLEMTSEAIGAAADKLIAQRTGNRTTGITSRQGRQEGRQAFAREIADTLTDYIIRGVDTGHSSSFDLNHNNRTYNNAFMQTCHDFIAMAMQLGDRPFYEQCYKEELETLTRLGTKIQAVRETANGNMETYLRDMTKEERHAEAARRATERVFQEDNELIDTINSLKRKSKGADIVITAIMPFLKTPTNVAIRAMQYSPVGLAYTVVKNGLIDAKTNNGAGFNQRQFVMNLGRGLTGTGMMALGLALANMGLIRNGREDEEDMRLAAIEKSNGRSYGMYFDIGGTQIPVDFAFPAISPLVIGAEVADSLQQFDGDGAALAADMAKRMAASSIDQLFDNSMLSGVADLFRGYKDGAQIATSVLEGVAENTASRLTPAAVRALAKFTDPYVRDTKSQNYVRQVVNQTIIQNWPVLRQTLPTAKTITGEDQFQSNAGSWGKENQNAALHFLNSFITPWTAGSETADARLDELVDIAYRKGETGWLPGQLVSGNQYEVTISKALAKELRVGKTGMNQYEGFTIRLTDEERRWLNDSYADALWNGSAHTKGLSAQMDSARWKTMDDEAKIEATRDAQSKAKKQVLSELVRRKKEAGEIK